MAKAKSPVPEGQHTISPHITVKNAPQAIEFYKKAFGAPRCTAWAARVADHARRAPDRRLDILPQRRIPADGGKSP